MVKVGILGYYLLNKEYITKSFCINKDKPEMRCLGRCHLKKQLQKQNEQEQKLPKGTSSTEMPLFLNSPPFDIFPPMGMSFSTSTLFYTSVLVIGSGKGIFHPPRTGNLA